MSAKSFSDEYAFHNKKEFGNSLQESSWVMIAFEL